MRVTQATLHRILVPLELPTIWINGADRAWPRTVVRLQTDEGIEGIAETSGDDVTYSYLGAIAQLFVGESPFDRQRILSRLWELPTQGGARGRHAVQAFETACLDAVGKAIGQPLHCLLGGALRASIPVIGYIHPRVDAGSGEARERLAEDVVTYASHLVETYGVGTLKLKGGVFPPSEEIASLRALRSAFPNHALRFDPNAAWSVETAERVGAEIEELSLEWFEDPSWGIEGMARTRRRVRMPLATNMCCVQLDQLSSAIRAEAFDVLLLDIDDWGGVTSTLKAAAACEVFNLGLGVHSSGEAGISTALHLHVAACLPTFPHAMDSYYHHQTADVITEGHRYTNGAFPVPEGPGLGVEIDDDKLARLEELYANGLPPVRDPTAGPRRPGLW